MWQKTCYTTYWGTSGCLSCLPADKATPIEIEKATEHSKQAGLWWNKAATKAKDVLWSLQRFYDVGIRRWINQPNRRMGRLSLHRVWNQRRFSLLCTLPHGGGFEVSDKGYQTIPALMLKHTDYADLLHGRNDIFTMPEALQMCDALEKWYVFGKRTWCLRSYNTRGQCQWSVGCSNYCSYGVSRSCDSITGDKPRWGNNDTQRSGKSVYAFVAFLCKDTYAGTVV